MKSFKTNVMRLLDEENVSYHPYSFDIQDAVDGQTMASLLQKPPESVFKTLVAYGASGAYYVFVVPVCCSLDLKKAAAVSCEKSITMLPQKELLPLTGYVHGGCSPIGMKKNFPVFVDETASLYETITFSAGKIGYQVEMCPSDLLRISGGRYVDIV